ncbi:MAG: hypothetical protein ACR2GY_07735 [Phycisphaerales bacterium]
MPRTAAPFIPVTPKSQTTAVVVSPPAVELRYCISRTRASVLLHAATNAMIPSTDLSKDSEVELVFEIAPSSNLIAARLDIDQASCALLRNWTECTFAAVEDEAAGMLHVDVHSATGELLIRYSCSSNAAEHAGPDQPRVTYSHNRLLSELNIPGGRYDSPR